MTDRWAVLMQAACRAGVTPEAFWRLSVREWALLTAAPPASAMTRGRFEQLTGRWPDDGKHGD